MATRGRSKREGKAGFFGPINFSGHGDFVGGKTIFLGICADAYYLAGVFQGAAGGWGFFIWMGQAFFRCGPFLYRSRPIVGGRNGGRPRGPAPAAGEWWGFGAPGVFYDHSRTFGG